MLVAMKAASLTAEDLFPLVAKLPPGERSRLAHYVLGLPPAARSASPPERWNLARLADDGGEDCAWTEAGLDAWAGDLENEDGR